MKKCMMLLTLVTSVLFAGYSGAHMQTNVRNFTSSEIKLEWNDGVKMYTKEIPSNMTGGSYGAGCCHGRSEAGYWQSAQKINLEMHFKDDPSFKIYVEAEKRGAKFYTITNGQKKFVKSTIFYSTRNGTIILREKSDGLYIETSGNRFKVR